MNHLGTKILKTDRLLLRPFQLTDAEAMYRNWASDPDVTRFLTWPTHTSPEVSAKVLADWVGQYGKPEFYQWATVPTEAGEPVGSIAVVGYDSRLGQPELGYCIGKKWWRQGYTSGALNRVIDFLFDEAGAVRIAARHDPRNPGSGAVMRKCGMTCEGTLRQADRNNQGICDACIYSILAEERRKHPSG